MFNQGNHEYIEYLSLGAEIAGGLSIPILIGYWIDNRLDTSPWFLLGGAIIGIAIMIGITFRIARKSSADQKKNDRL